MSKKTWFVSVPDFVFCLMIWGIAVGSKKYNFQHKSRKKGVSCRVPWTLVGIILELAFSEHRFIACVWSPLGALLMHLAPFSQLWVPFWWHVGSMLVPTPTTTTHRIAQTSPYKYDPVECALALWIRPRQRPNFEFWVLLTIIILMIWNHIWLRQRPNLIIMFELSILLQEINTYNWKCGCGCGRTLICLFC